MAYSVIPGPTPETVAAPAAPDGAATAAASLETRLRRLRYELLQVGLTLQHLASAPSEPRSLEAEARAVLERVGKLAADLSSQPPAS